jgi:succinate dehydrogenase / fumarate reductase cytochrome b subunit
MKEVFSHWWIVALYLAGIVALFWHLLHGFQSAWQTLGINNKKYTPIIKAVGIGYSIIICVLFALMPIAMHFKWLD